MPEVLSYQITTPEGQGDVQGADVEEALAIVLETIASADGEIAISARHLDLEFKVRGGEPFAPETLRLFRRMVESVPSDMKGPLNVEGPTVWLRMGNYL